MAFMFIKVTIPNMAINDLNEKVSTAPSTAMGVANVISSIQGGFINGLIDVTVRDVDASLPPATGNGVEIILNNE